MPPPLLEEKDPDCTEVVVIFGLILRKHCHSFTAVVGCKSYISVS